MAHPDKGNTTRATRGEARGHRSALAQNSLLMYPLLPPSFGLVVGLVCPRHMVEWPQCVCAAVGAFQLDFFRCRYFVDMWVAEGHTKHEDRAPAGANGGATLLGTMVPARLCVPIAVVQPTLVTPDGRGGLGGGGVRVRSFGIHLWVCVVAVMGRCDRGVGTSWRHPIDT